jgi:ABC-type branched-subunit amino acid transport system substrate-binding protein
MRGFLAFSGLAPFGLVACALIVNHADAQCSTDGDCAKYPGTVCVEGGCTARAASTDAAVKPDVPPLPTTCTSTQDCFALHGENWICRPSDHQCLSLVSPDCAQVVGPYQSDDVVLLGALLPLFGPHQSTGAGLSDAVRLATLDFTSAQVALPDGGTRRPISIVLCDESDDVDRAARHLRDDLGVAAILGTGESESTLKVAIDVTNQGNQLLMSPRATADLSSVTSKGLVWRTCPTDALEGAAMSAVMHANVEPVLNGQGVSQVRVAILHATDPESKEIASTIDQTLIVNGALATDQSNSGLVVDVDYGDPDNPTLGDPSGKYADAIQALTSQAALPDAILFAGTTQGVTNVLSGVEANWPPTAARHPFYVISSGAQTAELLTQVGTNDALRKRILGTAPGSNPATYNNLSKFIVRYRQLFTDGTLPETFGVAQAYDAFFTLAYAVSVARNADIDGTDLVTALRAILAPADAGAADGGGAVTVNVGPNDIGAALTALAQGESIALRGVSAPLAFDLQKGDLVTDVQVWCILPGQSSTPAYQFSGLQYSASSAQLVGSLGSGCGL